LEEAGGKNIALTLGSLFSGIGGFELGFQNASDLFKVKWQIENDPFCTSILERRFSKAKRYSDIKKVNVDEIERTDIICAGMPCQPYSFAGRRNGSNDSRYLWPETFNIVRGVRPSWFILENVRGLLTTEKGQIFSKILSDLASIGYNAEWEVLSARAFGAPHKRDRIFIVAYPIGKGLQRPFFEGGVCSLQEQTPTEFGNRSVACGAWWSQNISNIRMGDGVPLRLARSRVKSYGNAVCPPVIEFLAKRILEMESGLNGS
jgi:DNA (cytosine-5)-methyltransferase 1